MGKLYVATFMAAALAVSCGKAGDLPEEARPERAEVTLSIRPPVTKASETSLRATGGESALHSVDVFIFRSGQGRDSGQLDAYKRAEAPEIDAESHAVILSMEAAAGTKHIYAVANVPASFASGIDSETKLLAQISRFPDNTLSSFVMTGASDTEHVLESGAAAANQISIVLKRLAAKVKVEKITGAFTSPGLRQTEFRVRRIFLAYVPKEVKLIGGDALGESGYYTPAVLNEDGEVEIEPDDKVASLTSKVYNDPREGMIYNAPGASPEALDDHVMRPDLSLYMYPNDAKQTDRDGEADLTTKLVIETSLNGAIYYYPISLGYTRPNHAYTVSNVILTRLGSTDPNIPVTTADCTFSLTVEDWTRGEIIGSYNGKGEDGDFTI